MYLQLKCALTTLNKLLNNSGLMRGIIVGSGQNQIFAIFSRLENFFPSGSKYSRMDHVKFMEDSLEQM